MVKVKRAYETPSRQDGTRYLVDGLWPRGIKKEKLNAEAWLKDLASSKELRQWFQHDPQKWEEFKRRYQKEINESSESFQKLLDASKRGNVTLLFSAKDTERNNAVALKNFLEKKRPR